MRRVLWSAEAADHLDAIAAYIEALDPRAASRIAARLVALGESLSKFSERGRLASDGLREMTVVPPYILRYRVEPERVVIMQIRHGARDPKT